MSQLFTPLSETGRPEKNAGVVLARGEDGALCTYKGKNLDKIPFENVISPLGLPPSFADCLGEFVAEPQGLSLSFTVGYSFRVVFPSVFFHQLLEQGYEPEKLPDLSLEHLFKDVLSSYFASAMNESFVQEGAFSFAMLQSRMKKSGFAEDYLLLLNEATLFTIGLSFSSLRFGASERSSLKQKMALKSGKRFAQKASY